LEAELGGTAGDGAGAHEQYITEELGGRPEVAIDCKRQEERSWDGAVDTEAEGEIKHEVPKQEGADHGAKGDVRPGLAISGNGVQEGEQGWDMGGNNLCFDLLQACSTE
jgi:hypothetical protein